MLALIHFHKQLYGNLNIILQLSLLTVMFLNNILHNIYVAAPLVRSTATRARADPKTPATKRPARPAVIIVALQASPPVRQEPYPPYTNSRKRPNLASITIYSRSKPSSDIHQRLRQGYHQPY